VSPSPESRPNDMILTASSSTQGDELLDRV
jgi:hypothetical protein